MLLFTFMLLCHCTLYQINVVTFEQSVRYQAYHSPPLLLVIQQAPHGQVNLLSPGPIHPLAQRRSHRWQHRGLRAGVAVRVGRTAATSASPGEAERLGSPPEVVLIEPPGVIVLLGVGVVVAVSSWNKDYVFYK